MRGCLLFCVWSVICYHISWGQIKREFRGAWIATVQNLDWPSRAGLSAEEQQAELIDMLDGLKAYGINAVIFQVRPAGNVFFQSSFEPWSEYLTGTQGQYPGYDPLRFAIQAAHQRGMELHAWVNPFRVDVSYSLDKPLARNHLIRTHPEWILSYGRNLYLDPGIPAAQDYVLDVIEELVFNYAPDAIHLDDYFYPYPEGFESFPDTLSFAIHGNGTWDRARWRRENINRFIQALRDRLLRTNAKVKLGVSPFGVWRNQFDDPLGSATRAGVRSYDILHADVRHWLSQGWLDYVAPQLYFSIGYPPADYRVLINWWARQPLNAQLYIGHAVHKVGTESDPNWRQTFELTRQVEATRRLPQVQGSIFYRASFVLANPMGAMDIIKQQAYQQPALVPSLAYQRGLTPAPPAKLFAKNSTAGIVLNWIPSRDTTTYHAIYRAIGREKPDTTAAFLYQTIGHTDRWTDQQTKGLKKYSYLITTVNRQHVESKASQLVSKRNWWSIFRRKNK